MLFHESMYTNITITTHTKFSDGWFKQEIRLVSADIPMWNYLKIKMKVEIKCNNREGERCFSGDVLLVILGEMTTLSFRRVNFIWIPTRFQVVKHSKNIWKIGTLPVFVFIVSMNSLSLHVSIFRSNQKQLIETCILHSDAAVTHSTGNCYSLRKQIYLILLILIDCISALKTGLTVIIVALSLEFRS